MNYPKEVDETNLTMWKMDRGRYMFQTEDPAINKKLKGRRSFFPSAYGVNCYFWTYYTDLKSIRDAKKRFKSICGREPKYSEEKELYY